jgi:hypothetical protein
MSRSDGNVNTCSDMHTTAEMPPLVILDQYGNNGGGEVRVTYRRGLGEKVHGECMWRMQSVH